MRTCLTAIIGCTLFFAAAVADIDVRDADIDMYPAGMVYDPRFRHPSNFSDGHWAMRRSAITNWLTTSNTWRA